jgi:hypothetical protein
MVNDRRDQLGGALPGSHKDLRRQRQQQTDDDTQESSKTASHSYQTASSNPESDGTLKPTKILSRQARSATPHPLSRSVIQVPAGSDDDDDQDNEPNEPVKVAKQKAKTGPTTRRAPLASRMSLGNQRRVTLTVDELSINDIRAQVINDGMTEEEAEQEVSNHPGVQFRIYDAEKGEDWVQTCHTPEEFAAKISAEPEPWFWSLVRLYDGSMETAEELRNMRVQHDSAQLQIDELQNVLDSQRQESEDWDEQLTEAKQTITTQASDLARLRTHREIYKAKIKELEEVGASDVSVLQSKLDRAMAQVKELQGTTSTRHSPFNHVPNLRPQRRQGWELEDDVSDIGTSYEPIRRAERQERREDRGRDEEPDPYDPYRFQSPAMYGPGNTMDSATAGGNTKYPDAPMFSGEGSKIDYESWKERVLTKLRHSSRVYDNEWSRVEYARDRTEGMANSIIKVRSRYGQPNAYRNLKEFMSDLDSHFLDINAGRTAKAKLNQCQVKMKDNQSFTEWYATFSATLAPVYGNDDEQRKEWFNNNISDSLSHSISHAGFFESKSYAELVHHCKAVESRARTRVVTTKAYGGSRSSNNNNNNATKSSNRKDTRVNTSPASKEHDTPRRTEVLYRKLLSTGSCLHCGEKGHTHRSKEALQNCRLRPAKTDEALGVNYISLAAMTVDFPDEEEDGATDQDTGIAEKEVTTDQLPLN